MAWLRARAPEGPAGGVPAELATPDHPLWRGPAEVFIDYMTQRGWDLPVRERINLLDLGGGDVPPVVAGVCPQGRRRAAVEGWARDNGLVSQRWPEQPDRAALRGMGIL